jgi:hypothetical protein
MRRGLSIWGMISNAAIPSFELHYDWPDAKLCSSISAGAKIPCF